MAEKEVKMSKAVVLQFFLLMFVMMPCLADRHPSCKLWEQMARQLSSQPRRQMTCFSNETHPCTSVRCSGTYRYTSWLLPSSDIIEIDYCFGMRLNHCDQPVSMDVYLNVPDRNISYRHRISHNTQLKIPGLSINLKQVGSLDGFLFFHMVRNGSSVNLKITAKVRITANHLVMWPESMQKTIVPMETIEVPPCNEHGITTPSPVFVSKLDKCHPPKWQMPTNPPNVSTTTLNPIVTPSGRSTTYNKSCSQFNNICQASGDVEACDLTTGRCQCNPDLKYDPNLGSCVSQTRYRRPCTYSSDCGINEMCQYQKCICIYGYKFQRHKQMCVVRNSGFTPGHVTPKPRPIPHTNLLPKPTAMPHQPPQKAPPANNTAIIAGSVVGGILLIAVVVILIFVLVRRSRSPYENREMLLSNDDTDVIM